MKRAPKASCGVISGSRSISRSDSVRTVMRGSIPFDSFQSQWNICFILRRTTLLSVVGQSYI
jgi:hypothetical protein